MQQLATARASSSSSMQATQDDMSRGQWPAPALGCSTVWQPGMVYGIPWPSRRVTSKSCVQGLEVWVKKVLRCLPALPAPAQLCRRLSLHEVSLHSARGVYGFGAFHSRTHSLQAAGTFLAAKSCGI